MNPTRLIQLLCCLVVVGILAIATNGCKSDETTSPPPAGAFTSSSTSLSAAPGGTANATISGGTAPYSIQTGPDTVIATASLTGSNLTVNAVISGFTSLILKDAANATIRVSVSVTGPITYSIFPLVAGHFYVYGGYAINTSSNGSTRLPDPSNVYRTQWTVIGPGLPPPLPPIPGAYAIVDTTTLQITSGVVGQKRYLILTKNTTEGSFSFLQTLGPFFRAFKIRPIGRTDTTRFIKVADPSVGIGLTWAAFDSTYTDSLNQVVRLQIVGSLEAGEQITDSSSSHATYDALRFRTYRNIFIGSNQVVSNATTSKLWLVKDIGPVQVLISEDTENLGHFRVMKQKSF